MASSLFVPMFSYSLDSNLGLQTNNLCEILIFIEQKTTGEASTVKFYLKGENIYKREGGYARA
jgi:hypothetical protein